MSAVPPRQIGSVDDAYELLRELGAPERLLRHVKLVAEAAELFIARLEEAGVEFDPGFVRLGVAFHDAGKILHNEELRVPGKMHEPAGQELLLSSGVDARLARYCVSHGQWRLMACSFEELVVALADTLWKGKRDADLEAEVVERTAQLLERPQWEVLLELDTCFEAIAAGGLDRLARS